MIRFLLLPVCLVLSLLARPAAAEFPPISEAEKALTEVPGDPGAAAVVLFREGELSFQDLGKQIFESKLTVRTRIKILTDQGKDYGEIRLSPRQRGRLKSLEGRTVLPDGSQIPLDTQFEETVDRRNQFVSVVAAFDRVEVGAILDYEYVLRYQGIASHDPWLFQDRIPTLRSQITYTIPEHMGYQEWSKELRPGLLQKEANKRPRGWEVRVWLENQPAVPDEPYSFPIQDLANQFTVRITEYAFSGRVYPIMESWASACELYHDYYNQILRGDGAARRKAKDVAGNGSKMDQLRNVFRFVRDEILYGPNPQENPTADKILAQGRGNSTGQALLLIAMLDAIKIKADLLWGADRNYGVVDLSAPNEAWFNLRLVRAHLDNEDIFLFPSNRSLGAGQLPPGLEGVGVLVYDRSKPEAILTPSTPFHQSMRRAVLDLVIDEGGRVTGQGTLELTGHPAGEAMEPDQTAEERQDAWGEWLEARAPLFAVSDVAVLEDRDARRIEVRWKVTQPEEEVLGDEVSLQPSLPVGPRNNPFAAQGTRRTPVLLPFAESEEVETTVRWPAGWSVETAPEEAGHSGVAGSFAARVTPLPDGSGVRYQRRLEITERELLGRAKYQALNQLLDAARQHDAKALVVVKGGG